MKEFINAKIILKNSIVEGKNLLVDGSRIAGLTEERIPGAEIVDAHGLFLSPGLVDMHVHGGDGADYMDGTAEAFQTAARCSLAGGATTVYPTTLCAPMDKVERIFEVFRRVKDLPGLPHMPGLHLEGPFFSAEQAGAQNPEFLKAPSEEDVQLLLRNRDVIARVSAACELPGVIAMGDRLKAAGIICSIGHSNAVYEDVLEAVQHGFTLVTHLYSGMSSITRHRAHRVLGVLESAYLLDELDVEIIADGHHLPRELLQLIVKLKNPDQISLVTDALRGAGMPEGSRIGIGDDGRWAVIENGVAYMPDHSCFAGSVTSAIKCVRTMWKDVGLPLWRAVQMMSFNPCRVMGISAHKGEIAPGKDADLILFDERMEIEQIWLMGEKAG